MENDEQFSITITRESLFTQPVEDALTRQRALERLAAPSVTNDVSPLRRVLFSTLFYLPFFSILGAIIGWLIVEPGFTDDFDESALATILAFIFFPLICGCITAMLLIGEGIVRRTLGTALRTGLIRGLATFFMTMVPLIAMGIIAELIVFPLLINGMEDLLTRPDFATNPNLIYQWMTPPRYLVWIVFRSTAWMSFGAMIGVGLYIGRGTPLQLQSAVVGGAVGGAVGGILFDVLERFAFGYTAENADLFRFVGVCSVGLFVGVFVALAEQLSREGWFRVRTGPLAGKAFVIHRDITTIGSAPQADIYLFKDAEIDPKHAIVHRLGASFLVEDAGSRDGTRVNGSTISQRRLQSGDQVAIGATILEFEERAKRVRGIEG